MRDTGRSDGCASGGFEDCAAFLCVLGEPTRLELLASITAAPACVRDLCGRTGLESSLLSHHLRELRIAGLVEFEQEGARHVFHPTAAVRCTAPVAGRTTLMVRGERGEELALPVPAPSPPIEVRGRRRAGAARDEPPSA